MYCKIIYYDEKVHGFSGRSYTYSTRLPLLVGDKVLAPVAGEDTQKRAMVVEVHTPESEIDPSLADRIKEICEWDQTDMQELR